MSKKLERNAAVSVLQTVISGLVLFLLYRYLIDHLGAEQLGLWSVILASTSVARLSDMGLTGSVVKFVASYRAIKDDIQAAEVVQTAAISIALVMAALVLAVYPLLDDVLKLSIPAVSMQQALTILPWAVLSLWLGTVGGVFQSGLDGCQRIDIRNILMIVGNVLFFAAAIWLVPSYGLVGLAIAQAAQAFLIMFGSWLALRRELSSLPVLPIYWSKEKLKEMFGYAVNYQISSMAILFFEPITKLLMSRYGGLSSAAYYEMASQLVVKLRALIIAANQAIVPAVAELHETEPEKVSALYLKSYCLLFFVIVPFYTAIIISLPTISSLWIGRSVDQFILFGVLLAAGWGLNNLVGPAYFINMGTGHLKWNTIAHVTMAILNVLLCSFLGSMFGALGVALGAMLALIVGSWIVVHGLHQQYKISLKTLLPAEHFPLLIASLVAITFTLIINASSVLQLSALVTGSLGFGVYCLSVGTVVWRHPYKQMFIQRYKSRG